MALTLVSGGAVGVQMHRAQVVGTAPTGTGAPNRMPAACVITRGIGATSSADHRNFPTVNIAGAESGGLAFAPALLLAMEQGGTAATPESHPAHCSTSSVSRSPYDCTITVQIGANLTLR